MALKLSVNGKEGGRGRGGDGEGRRRGGNRLQTLKVCVAITAFTTGGPKHEVVCDEVANIPSVDEGSIKYSVLRHTALTLEGLSDVHHNRRNIVKGKLTSSLTIDRRASVTNEHMGVMRIPRGI